MAGTDLHQGTITDDRTGINGAAVALAPPGGAPVLGRRPNADHRDAPPRWHPHRVLPDVFVYRGGFDRLRRSLSLRREGVPALAIEVISQDTREVNLGMAEGKGWTYAAAGVAEYLILDPIGRYLRTQAQGHHTQGVPGTRLAGGVHALQSGPAGYLPQRVVRSGRRDGRLPVPCHYTRPRTLCYRNIV